MDRSILEIFSSKYLMNTPLQSEEIVKVLNSKGVAHFPPGLVELYTNFNGSEVLIGNAMWNFWKITDCYLLKFKDCEFLCFCDAYLETPIYGISVSVNDSSFGKVFDLTYHSKVGLSLYDFLEKVYLDVDFFVQIN